MITAINLSCEYCGKNFIVKKGREKKFCSKECKLNSRAKNDEIYYIEKQCECCGKIFKSKIKQKRKYCSNECSSKTHKDNSREDRICLICGKTFNERIKHDRKFCSEKCRLIWQTTPENIETRKNASKNIMLKKYGVENSFQIPDIQKKAQKNAKETYKIRGKEISKIITKKVEEKRQQKLIKRFSEIGYSIIEFNDEDITVKHPDGHIFKNNRKLIVNRLNHNVELSTNIQPIGSPRTTYERKICKLLKDNNIKYIPNDRKTIKLELDILIPSNNLAIEIDGLRWHSEYYINDDYHLIKTKKCEEKNIQLLHFFEDELIEKYDIIESIIKTHLNLYDNVINLDDCVISEINNETSSNFLKENHIQGNINSSIKIGLFYHNTLVSIMTFSKLRNVLGNKKVDEYELLRFCNKINHNIVNSSIKLYNYFKLKYNPSKVIGFADRRYDNGIIFNKLKFILDSETRPNYWYVLGKQRKHKFLYKKDVLIKEGFDNSKTEHKIMLERKIPRIFDCGKLKYIDL